MKQYCICSRLYRFEASHYERFAHRRTFYNGDIVEFESKEAFGKARNPHGHNYELKVNLAGEVDPRTGMVVELSLLDELVRDYLKMLDHKNLAELPHFTVYELPITQEFIGICIIDDLYRRLEIPFVHSIKLSENDNDACVFIHKETPMTVYHTKTFTFNAQHSLKSAALSKQDNQLAYGKCMRPHGHDYTLKVTICGSPNKRTNKLLIEHKFEEGITQLLERFDYNDLNTLPEFSSWRMPTTENIIKVLYDHISVIIAKLADDKFSSKNVRLAFLELQETNRNRFLYFGEETPKQKDVEASTL